MALTIPTPHFDFLLQTCLSVKDAASVGRQSAPDWSQPLDSFAATYQATNRRDGFVTAMRNFHSLHRHQYLNVVVLSETDVNDDFFAESKLYPNAHGVTASYTRGQNSRLTRQCTGPVVYLFHDRPGLTNVALPLGEIYREAITLGSKHAYSVLYAFYQCVLDFETEQPATLQTNVRSLQAELAGLNTPSDFSGLGDLLTNFVSSFNLQDPESLSKGLSGLASQVERMVEGTELSSTVNAISQALQTQKLEALGVNLLSNPQIKNFTSSLEGAVKSLREGHCDMEILGQLSQQATDFDFKTLAQGLSAPVEPQEIEDKLAELTNSGPVSSLTSFIDNFKAEDLSGVMKATGLDGVLGQLGAETPADLVQKIADPEALNSVKNLLGSSEGVSSLISMLSRGAQPPTTVATHLQS